MIIGVDGGLQGAIVALSDRGQVLSSHRMPLDKTRKFDVLGTYQIFKVLSDSAVDRFDDVSVCLEGLLSLPSDTMKITTMVRRLESIAVDDADETNALYEAIYVELKKTDGRVGTKTMGVNWGIIKGIVTSFGWPLTEVSPRGWQKYMYETANGKLASKLKSFEVCKQLWPEFDLCRGRKHGFWDGLADAALIAEYLRRKLK